MAPPDHDPLGLQLTRTARTVSRAFDAALASAGGSLPQWLILVELKGRAHGNQRAIAEAVGVEGPTLTHHLNRMEAAGLITRLRNAENRRIHQVELTPSGEALFRSLLEKVVEFDERLRRGLSERDVAQAERLFDRLASNAAPDPGCRRRVKRADDRGRPPVRKCVPRPAGSSGSEATPGAPRELRPTVDRSEIGVRRRARQWATWDSNPEPAD